MVTKQNKLWCPKCPKMSIFSRIIIFFLIINNTLPTDVPECRSYFTNFFLGILSVERGGKGRGGVFLEERLILFVELLPNFFKTKKKNNYCDNYPKNRF